MLKHIVSLSFLWLAITTTAQKPYTYASVPGDPIEARIYTLDNGLQVWLSRNPDAPRLQTMIATRAGSKNDPADATGLAHYLEHMLFKGTHEIGTADWEKESALLRAISDQYELRRRTTDEAQRDAIYRTIDSLSTEAAKYAVPNEYDKMVSSLGARGTNAFTSNERTVYINDLPSNELEKWMMIESVRFQQCVLRLFHTELETVFEEFNRGQDNDGRNAYQAMAKALWKNHPYGTQTTIGTGEHLKNPSMVKIHEYFDTYYVPNNMAVILAGDIDYEKTIAMVDKYFGGWKRKEVPAFTFKPEDPITAPEVVQVYGPQEEWVDLGWRFGGYGTDDPIMLELIDGLLNNGQAGLIDINLLQKQQVLEASTYAGTMADYAQFGMNGKPRQGQTLEEVRDLLLAELEKLKRGQFDDWLIGAVVTDLKMNRIRSWSDNNSSRASAMMDAFILKKQWPDVLGHYDRMSKITKEQVIGFAKRNFGSNYVCVFKRTGENKDAFKVTKPAITPIDIKRDRQSAFKQAWDKVPSARLEPQFIDYASAITERKMNSGVPVHYVKNPSNELFTLQYILEMGTDNDRKLDAALRYLPYLGTTKYTPEQFQKELFKLGLSFDVFPSNDRVYVSLTGLEENLAMGVELFEHLLADAQPNPAALTSLVSDIVKERNDGLKNKGNILQNGLFSHARWGANSPLRSVLTTAELNALDPAELVKRIHELTSYEHHLFYYGRKGIDEVLPVIDAAHRVPKTFLPYPPAQVYKEQDVTASTVLFAPYDMVQTELLFVSKDEAFNKELLPVAGLFNEYFGSGLSSIVFQEIRESKALAYSAFAAFGTPAKKEWAHYVRGYIGTQSDKLGMAVDAMLALLNDMPRNEVQFNGAKEAALKRIESDRVTKQRIYWSYDALKRQGITWDIRKDNYERIKTLTLDDLATFFNGHIKGRHYTYCVIGKEGVVDMKALEKLGPVRLLSLMELFGYDEVK